MPTTRRAVLCLLLLPFILFMAIKTRSQNRAAAVKQAKSAPQSKPASGLRGLPPGAREWVDSTMRRMTVDEKIGQLLFTWQGDVVLFGHQTLCENRLILLVDPGPNLGFTE